MRPSILVVGVVLCVLSFASVRAGDADEIELVLTEPLPLEGFLQAVGRITHATFVWDPGAAPLKTAELVSARNVKAPRQEFFAMIRGLLASYGLGLVSLDAEGHGVYRVVDLAAAGRRAGFRLKPQHVELTEKTLPWLAAQDGLYVTAAMPVGHLRDLEAAAATLGALASADDLGKVVAAPEAGVLVVTDFAPVVAELHTVLRELDERARRRAAEPPAHADSTRFEIHDLEWASAEEITRTLVEHFGASASGSENGNGWVRIDGDARTNRLLIRGTPARVEEVLRAIRALDVEVYASRSWGHVIDLEHMDAETAARVFRPLIVPSGGKGRALTSGPVRISACQGRKALLVHATVPDYETIREMVKQIDLPVEKTSVWTHVVPLEHVEAGETARVLQTLLGDEARIVPHEGRNALLITSTPQVFERIQQVLETLDAE